MKDRYQESVNRPQAFEKLSQAIQILAKTVEAYMNKVFTFGIIPTLRFFHKF